MKFSFDKTKCSKLGLILKYGNLDNLTFFFDEVEEAACYRLQLFRTDLINEFSGYILNALRVKKDKYNFECNFPIYMSGVVEIDEYLDDKINSLYFSKNKLLSQSLRVEYKNIHTRYKNDERCNESIGTKYFRSVTEIDFSEIKYITTLESDRNSLYFYIDFLPVGKYIAILQVEDRTGEIIETSYPYYFGIEKKTNEELMKAIGAVGRAAAGHSVTI